MKCPKCGNEFSIQLATKAKAENCKVLTSITSILTVQCDNCKSVFQLPLQGKNFLSVNKDR